MGRFMQLPPGTETEKIRYGIGPDGKEDSWAILCTVKDAQGPFTAERTVTRGEWKLDPQDPRSRAIPMYEYRIAPMRDNGVSYALSRFMQRHGWRLQRRVARSDYLFGSTDGWETISEDVPHDDKEH